MEMFLDRSLYSRLMNHIQLVVDETVAEESPFPHILIKEVFPPDVYRRLLHDYPSLASFSKANPKHHTNEYGGSTRQRMTLSEAGFSTLSEDQHRLWATVRAAISSREVRDLVFSKLAKGLCRRFKVPPAGLREIPAFPRGQLYSEVDGYRILPHPDTREKIVTMQFAFPADTSLCDVGTEFYTRSLNPAHYLREPRGLDLPTFCGRSEFA